MGFRLIRVFFMDLEHIAAALVAIGCPAVKSRAMAAQLDRRAHQLAAEKGRTYEEALLHLLKLMREGMSGNPVSPAMPPGGNDAG
jgi:hypothetical protein